MLRIISVLIFIHWSGFGQSVEMIEYNEFREEIYECLNLESFQDSKKDFHLRINIKSSVIVDIYRNKNEIKGTVYNYIYQDEKQLVNREFVETNTYIHKTDSLNTEEINSIIYYIDSISSSDSIDLPRFRKFSCGIIQPVVNIQIKDSCVFHHRRIHIDHINVLLENKKLQRINTELWPYGQYSRIGGSSLCLFSRNPMRIYFSGLSSQFSSRNEQNFDLISNWGSNFEISNSSSFDLEFLGGDYSEYFYKVNL